MHRHPALRMSASAAFRAFISLRGPLGNTDAVWATCGANWSGRRSVFGNPEPASREFYQLCRIGAGGVLERVP